MPNLQISSYFQESSPRHWIRTALKSLLFLGAVTLPLGVLNPRAASAATCSAGVITRTSSPVFYIDTSSSVIGNYVSYTITNTSGSAYTDLWVKLESFSGGRITLAASESGIAHVGTLANGASKTVFFYLANTGTGATSTPQSHTVSLYSTRPDLASGSLCGDAFSQTVDTTISALANKVTAVVAGPNPPELGGIMTITATGDTGTIGSAGIFAPTPASFADWPANSYKMVGTRITFMGGNTGTFNNILYTSGLNSKDTSYEIVYTFVASGITTAPTSVTPVTQISSGTQVKHNDTSGSSLLAILPTTNKVTLTKSVSSTALPVGGIVTYTITLNNAGAVATTLDDIVDLLPSSPSNATYVSGSAKFNGSTISNPFISGQTLTFLGLFTVPPGGTSTLTYQATIPSTNGTYTNSAIGHVNATQIDTTLTTADNAPATATVNVGTPDLTLTKSHTGNFTVGSAAAYALTVGNTGSTSTSGTVTIVDTLPTGLTIPNGAVTLTGANAANWTCTATSNVITCTSSTAIAVSGTSTFNLTGIQVGAAAVGSVTNVAVVSGGGEVNTANNSASDATTVTASDLTLSKTHTGNFTVGTPASYVLSVQNAGTAATSGTITVTDTLPTGLTLPNGTVTLTGTNAANWSCAVTSNVITCTSSTVIAAGSTSTFTLTGIQVGVAAIPTVTNNAAVAGGNEVNTTNNAATDPTIVNGISDLTLTKSHTGNFTVSTPGTYALTVNNIGSAATSGTITLTDTLPTGLTMPNGAVTLTGTNAANWSCTASGNVITCTTSTIIASSGSSTFNLTGIQVGSAAVPSVTNTASVSGGGQTNTANDSASDPTTVQIPDLTLTKSHTGNFTVGTPGVYVLTANNVGTAPTSGTITITDALPTGLTIPNGSVTLTGTNAANWSCSATNNVITCTSSAVITVGGSSTFSLTGIQVGAAAIPSVTNTASVTGGNDASPANNTASNPTTVNGVSDLTIAKTHTGNFTDGTNASYSLTVGNAGSAITSGTITLTDTLPTGLTVPNGAVAITGTNAANWSCSASSNVITCTSTTAIAVGGSSTFNLTGIRVGATAVPTVTNSVTVAGGGETNTTNNTATDVATVTGVSDLTLSKTHAGSFTYSTPATYTLTVNNIGSATTSGTMTVSDTLPTGLTLANGAVTLSGTNAANWSCSASNNVITCTSSTAIAAGGSSTFNLTGIQVGAAAVPAVINTAAVSGGGETKTNNNAASDTATVIAPDLTLAKTHSGTFSVGTSASYTLTLNNAGTAPTSGTITVSDTLPTGLTIPNGSVTLTGTNAANWSCSATNNVITCTSSAVIAAGGSSIFNLTGIQVGAAAIPTVTNTASVAGGNDVNTTNNTATDPTTVNGVSDLTITKTHTGNFTQGQTGATYTLTVTNAGTAATSGSVTVIDAVPTGLTATAATGTGWVCALNTPAVGKVQCTRSDGLATGSSYPPITLTVDVDSNAASSVINSVSVSGGAQTNTGNDTATDPTVITVPAKVLLVKRITEINGDRTQNPNATSNKLDQVLDRPSFAADDTFPANNWPSNFLKGAYDAGPIKPNDVVEYTVYFMNSSGSDAANFRICDRIVGSQQFVPDAYGTGRDIEYKLGANAVQYLTRASLATVDRAELDASTGAITGCPAPSITGTNNGTVVIDITGSSSSGQQTLTTLPGATGQGTPINSYGYFRFKTTVNP